MCIKNYYKKQSYTNITDPDAETSKFGIKSEITRQL